MRGNLKKIWTVFIILCLTFLLGGCGFVDDPADLEQDLEQPGEKQPQEALPEYEIITDAEQLPEEVKSLAGYLENRRGYFVFTPREYATGEDTYLLIFSGEKPGGGYTLDLDSAAVVDGILEIVVQEGEPAANEGVIQIITYPQLILKMGREYQGFHVVNDKDENFAAIPADEVPEIIKKEGVYIGQIDNNFIEMEIDGQAQSFMLGSEAVQLLEEIRTGDEVLVSYYKNDVGQLIIVVLEIK
ncbi:MAG: protease complex subunit PrcB family protein [Firmicutes bacterium]|jgi:hypothetical protein|nr:protease complex subunit PrcB family protein [Bacillota bacterium]